MSQWQKPDSSPGSVHANIRDATQSSSPGLERTQFSSACGAHATLTFGCSQLFISNASMHLPKPFLEELLLGSCGLSGATGVSVHGQPYSQ